MKYYKKETHKKKKKNINLIIIPDENCKKKTNLQLYPIVIHPKMNKKVVYHKS